MKKLIFILTTLYIIVLLSIVFIVIHCVTRPVEKIPCGHTHLAHNEVVNIIDSILDSRVTLEAEDVHDDCTTFEENTGGFNK